MLKICKVCESEFHTKRRKLTCSDECTRLFANSQCIKRVNAARRNVKRCTICGSEFTVSIWRKAAICSDNCRNQRFSECRSNAIANKQWNSKRRRISYKSVQVEVDSFLEEAAIQMIVDELNASNIQRFKSILTFKEEGVTRRFNPDFICHINQRIVVVEVKQAWNRNSKHSYNRTIPLKRAALEKFCIDRNYSMLWVDSIEFPQLKSFYTKILKSRDADK